MNKINIRLKRLFTAEEDQYIISIGEAYQKEVRLAADEKQKSALQLKGRMGYLEDWIQKKVVHEPGLQDVLTAIKERVSAVVKFYARMVCDNS